jgi:RimJ/RimL family protein N-acetyltransferase
LKSIEETRQWMSTKVFTQGPADVIGRSFHYAILDKSIQKSQEQLIGSVSISAVDPFPEIGYALLPESWGKGYMTEALNMLLKMWWELPRRSIEGGPQSGEQEKVFALCETQNVGSSGVLKKCGFKFVSEYRHEQDELDVWGLEKPRI